MAVSCHVPAVSMALLLLLLLLLFRLSCSCIEDAERKDVFAPDAAAIIHCVGRTVSVTSTITTTIKLQQGRTVVQYDQGSI